jgi:N-acetyl-gamma-glutamyl-phosphate reductase/acetylglutamate kinase
LRTVVAAVARAHAQDTIIRLLYSLGSRHEVERYLRIFTSSSKASSGGVLPEAKFAVLK